MNTCTGHPLLLEQCRREADSKQVMKDQVESNLLLRIQVEDLQKMLEDKEDKLTEAQETIRILRNEVQSLQEQLVLEKSKHQKSQSLRSRHVRAKAEVNALVCKGQPPRGPPCMSESSYIHPFCSGITEALPRSQDVVPQNLPIMSENWSLPWRARTNHMQTGACVDQPIISPSCVWAPSATQPSGFIRNSGRSPEQPTVKTLVVRLEDCQHKLGSDGVFRLPERKEDEEEEEGGEEEDMEFRNCDLESKTASSGMGDSHPCETQMQEDRANGLYVCRQCSRAFSQPILLSLHMKMHNISGITFSDDSGHPSHGKRKTNELSYCCDVCNKAFSQSNHLKLHQRMHRRPAVSQQLTKDGQKFQKFTHTCDECNKTFSRINYLRLHQRRHRKQRYSSVKVKTAEELQREMSAYACDQCTKTFSQMNDLRLHQRKHRRPLEPLIHVEDVRKSIWKTTYPCNQCGKIFSELNFLRRHQKTRCMILSPIPCFEEVQGRKKKKSSKNAPSQCVTCGKVFSSKSYLKIHQRVHTKEKPYACGACDQTFASSSNLYTHQRKRHKGELGTCSECGRSVLVTGPSQESPLECASCLVAQKQNRLQHQGQQKAAHRCPQCPLMFSSTAEAKRHEKSHGHGGSRGSSLALEVRSASQAPAARCEAAHTGEAKGKATASKLMAGGDTQENKP